MHAILLIFFALLFTACGAGCPEVKESREAFLTHTATSILPHATLEVPFDLVERLLAEQLKAVQAAPLAIPGLEQVRLGKTSVKVQRIRMRPAAPGFLAFDLDFAVRHKRRVLFSMATTAQVKPRLNAKAGTLEFAIGPQSLRKVAPRLGPKAAASLTAYLHKRLPFALRLGLSRRQLRRVIGTALAALVNQGYALLRDSAMAKLGPLATFKLKVSDLPLRTLTIHSQKGWFTVNLFTALPVAQGLQPASTRPKSERLRVRVAGATVAALGNLAIASGEFPARYTKAGKPKKDGPYEVGLAWEASERPMKIKVWRTDDTCVEALLGGTPKVRLRKSNLTLKVADGTVEAITGSTLVKVGAWLTGVWDRTLRFAHKTSSALTTELGSKTVRVEVIDADLNQEGLVLHLDLRHM